MQETEGLMGTRIHRHGGAQEILAHLGHDDAEMIAGQGLLLPIAVSSSGVALRFQMLIGASLAVCAVAISPARDRMWS